MNKKLKLAPYVLKKYEQKLDTYFFYNVNRACFWHTDPITGSIVASLDGTVIPDDLLDTLSANSPDVDSVELKEHFYKIFEFLIREKFLCE